MTKAKFGWGISEMWEKLQAELIIAAKQRQCKDISTGIDGKLICVEPSNSWADLACMLSCNLPGQIWVGSNSACWVYNKQSLYLCVKNRLEGIKAARDIVRQLTGLPEEKIRCSAAGCARHLLEWVDIRQTDGRALDSIGACDSWAYQYCDPTDLPQGYLWDVESCYYLLLCRAPSPRVILLAGKLKWCPIEREEMQRWQAMLKAAGPHKGIRNSFIGQMYAQSNGTFYSGGESNQKDKAIELLRAEDGVTLYQTGAHLDALDDRAKEEPKQARPGPLRPLACLIVRSAYELCAMAARESNAIYSNTDCVITAQPESPRIWAKYGLKVKLKGVGPTSVHTLGYYRVGDESTIPYQKGKEGYRPRMSFDDYQTRENVRLILRGQTWCNQWLKVGDSWEPDAAIVARDEERARIKTTLKEVSRNALQR